MGAHPTLYCLDEITDYFEFERLCHDLMARVGFSGIEPLGGFRDKGRDAIHFNEQSDRTTIFCYSVREDWRAKLAEDAAKIYRHNHECDRIVFLTTATLSAGERDEAKQSIREEYNWALDLYGKERLRVLLDSEHPDIKRTFSHLFPIQEAADDHLDIILLSAQDDTSLAHWLESRLAAAGFEVLHLQRAPRTQPLAEPRVAAAGSLIGIFSPASVSNADFMQAWSLAASARIQRNDGVALQAAPAAFLGDLPPNAIASSPPLEFEQSWASGLSALLAQLPEPGSPRLLAKRRADAVNAYSQSTALVDEPETVYSNYLRTVSLPAVIKRFRTRKPFEYDHVEEIKLQWAFRRNDDRTLLSFHSPPEAIAERFDIRPAGGASWRDLDTVEGINSINLSSELLKKTLVVATHQRGLNYCRKTGLLYFPHDTPRLPYKRVDGVSSRLAMAGVRKFWRPVNSEMYRWAVAPTFRVTRTLSDGFSVVVRLHIRLSDEENRALASKKRISRRKHLCRSWWNDAWLNRTIAVCQFLAEENLIALGDDDERVEISSSLETFEATMGLDESRLEMEEGDDDATAKFS